MAHLHRLIVVAWMAVFSFSAHALIPPVSQWYVQWNWETAANRHFGTSASDACTNATSAAVAKAAANGTTFAGVTFTAPKSCVAKDTTSSPVFGSATAVELAAGCPSNSTASGSQCQCASGYVEFGGTSCVVDNGCMTTLGMTPPNDGACQGGNCQYSYKVSSGESAVAQPYGRFCSKGCTVKGELNFCGQYSSGVMIAGQGICEIKNSFYTGDKCTGSGAVSGPSSQGTTPGTTTDPAAPAKEEANPVPQRLPPGKCPGQVNGVDVVVTCGSTAGNDTSTSNGSTVKPDGTTVNNTTNNTTIKTTVCNGGSCTTTTTVTSGGAGPNGTGAGSSTTTTQETAPKAEACSKNPGSAACKGDDEKAPNGFGGSCGAGFKAISEDAVVNAMAEETFRQNCKVNPDDGAQTVGRDAATKTGNQTGDNPNNSAVSIGSGSFDSSNALGGVASCIPDKTIVVMGRSINIAFSMICQYLEALGLVMLGVASLLALRIVTRG